MKVFKRKAKVKFSKKIIYSTSCTYICIYMYIDIHMDIHTYTYTNLHIYIYNLVMFFESTQKLFHLKVQKFIKMSNLGRQMWFCLKKTYPLFTLRET